MVDHETGQDAILDESYWRNAFVHPETRPLLTLLLDLPPDLAARASPVAAMAFPDFPVETRPPPEGNSPSIGSLSLWTTQLLAQDSARARA